MSEKIEFELNGSTVSVDTDASRKLLWVLRSDLEVTGPKLGCGRGYCGACTVLVDGEPVHSCRTRLDEVRGKSVTSIEGLAKDGELHPLQKAFVEHDALQCGYCTPGMLLTATALLDRNPAPSTDEVKEALAGNLCRCTGYTKIVEAVELAAARMQSAS